MKRYILVSSSIVVFIFIALFIQLNLASDPNNNYAKKSAHYEPSDRYANRKNRFLHPLSYYKENYSNIIITGVIDDNFVDQIRQVPNKNSDIIIYSKGGISQEAIKAARIIHDRKHNLIILGKCSSACAEFLLPAANSLTFVEEPVIGFHGNTIAEMHYVKEATGDIAEYCSSVHATEHKIFLLETLRDFEFWRKTIGTSKTLSGEHQ